MRVLKWILQKFFWNHKWRRRSFSLPSGKHIRRICYHNQLWLPRGKYLCSGQNWHSAWCMPWLWHFAEYEKDQASFGAVVGRHANRIEKGTFTLNDKTYHLVINNGPNHLHGGTRGFHYYNWESAQVGNTVRFTRVSPDGEEGYPGTLTMSVTYAWSEDNELSISYEASSDQDTVFNTTNHSYFNLNGEASGSVLEHILMINADQYTETDENDLTTGVISDVAGTPFDFRTRNRSDRIFCRSSAVKIFQNLRS